MLRPYITSILIFGIFEGMARHAPTHPIIYKMYDRALRLAARDHGGEIR
jgi:hypothetical protein